MSVKDSQTLKQLETRKSKMEGLIAGLQSDIQESQSRLSDAKDSIKAINAQIDSLKRKDPVVTEHAIIRYLERAMGLDLEQVKHEILPDDVAQMVKSMGNGKYPIGNGCKIVVKNSAVVSVV